ncbi:hypothetical protein [Rhodococcus sp. WY5]|uniref:hypothetical protein n=1 Tax=Rhodococcus sp. WY5 TaxID=2708349 RepID=UPI002032731C|nr:hypothetical protein [Rhodococcus sp. WY5]
MNAEIAFLVEPGREHEGMNLVFRDADCRSQFCGATVRLESTQHTAQVEQHEFRWSAVVRHVGEDRRHQHQ